jgi:hypothetical protein
MHYHDYLPQATALFREWVKNFFTVLAKIYTGLGIDQAVYEALVKAKAIWDAADAAAENVLTATMPVIHERRRVMKAFAKQIRTFVAEYIAHNHRLTPAEREELGLVTAHLTNEVLSKRPLVEITIIALAQITVHCRGYETKWGMLAGARGFEWRWVISDTRPESYDDFPHSEFSTRAHYTKTFDYNQRAKKLYSVFRWENATGEKGPWTEIFETIIP